MTAPAFDPAPVLHFEFAEGTRPVLTGYRNLDSQRARHPVFRASEPPGYHVFTEHDTILEALQNPELFSSHATVPTMPEPGYRWIPLMLDPPEHGKWRRLLGGWFTPRRTEGMDRLMRERAARLVEELAPTGGCDFVADFAGRFPTSIFLDIMGLPIDELDRFMAWEDAIMHFSTGSDPDHSALMRAMDEVQTYLGALVAQRRANPVAGADDIVSASAGWTVDGEPVADQDVLACLLLLFMAGLDTVANQLSYAAHHLATHPDHRERLAADPSLAPVVVEELLRAYPIVVVGRRVTRDVQFHGCPLAEGEVVSFPLPSAGRDEKLCPRATEVDLDRGTTRHISFGAGPHRCLGSHLARRELAVALQEWHRRIPDYRLADGIEVTEHAGNGVWGIDALPLRWSSG